MEPQIQPSMATATNPKEKEIVQSSETSTPRSSVTARIPIKVNGRKRWMIAIVVSLLGIAGIIALVLALTVFRKGVEQPRNKPLPDVVPTTTPADSLYPGPVSMNGTIPNNVHYQTMDPSLTRRKSDGKLFLHTTGGPNGTLWTADSLYGPWTKSPDSIWDSPGGGPQVYYLNGTYYMFRNSHEFNYSTEGVKNPASRIYWHDASVLVYSSKTMNPGDWTAHGRLEIPWAMDYNILDPSLLTINDTTGSTTHLLSFGSYQEGLFQVPLSHPPTSLNKYSMDNLTHLEYNTTKFQDNTRSRTEASFQYYRDPYYYLFYSSGRCCHDNGTRSWRAVIQDPYRVVVCRSQHPRDGYVDKRGRDCLTQNGGTEILGSHGQILAPGGQGVMDDEEVGTILYYHYVVFGSFSNHSEPGYRFGWNKLNFTDGWPVVV